MKDELRVSDGPFILGAFALGLVVRVLANILLQGLSSPPNPGFPDTVGYASLAQNLASGGRYVIDGAPTLHFPPGVPFLLASAFWVQPHGYNVARLLFSVLGALTCLPAYRVAFAIGGRRPARVAALILACYPESFYWSMHFTPEVPAALLMMLGVWLAQRADETRSLFAFLGVGALLAAQGLVTPRMLLVVPVFFALRFIHTVRFGFRWSVLPAVVSGVALVIVLAPWTLRNYVASGRFVLVSSHGGSTLLAGNNPLVFSNPRLIGSWYQGSLSDVPGWSEIASGPATDQNMAARSLAVAFLRSLSPSELVRLEFMKLYRFLTPLVDSPNATYRVAIGASWAFLAPFALMGLLVCFRDSRAYELHAVLLTYVLLTLVFFGEARYRATISPVLVVYAALGLTAVTRRFMVWRRWPSEVSQ